MTKATIFFFFSLTLFLSGLNLTAQETTIDQDFKASTIESLSTLMNDYYVFPEVAKKTEEHLNEQLRNGKFDEYNDLEKFAAALTEEVQSINHDKHMRIRPTRPRVAKENTPERMLEDRLYGLERSRRNTAGFQEVKKLEGNVGYLDLRGFAGTEVGIPIADSYMNLMSTSDAIIIDLRKNGGGSPSMVQYLCSYFFDEHVHLNSLYWREGDVTNEYWTLDKVGGKKLPDVPLFVLTSPRTFSGAEEFSYNMQTQKRATLVGETTGGGANPGDGYPINKKLDVFIPTGKAINPITKTNWEGTGVVPEIKTSAEDAFDKGHELAKEAAEDYRKKKRKEFTIYFSELQASIENYPKNKSYKSVFEELKTCNEKGLLGEDEINGMGYEYFMNKKTDIAEIIFKSNTELFPNSANVYDSYGEALAENGKLNDAVNAYQKAVDTAEKNEDPGLIFFKENLKKVKERKDGRP